MTLPPDLLEILVCPKCKDELAFLQSKLPDYGPKGRAGKPSLALLVVCTDASGEKLKRFIASRGYTFPVAADPEW